MERKNGNRKRKLMFVTAVALGFIVLLMSSACSHTAEVVGADGELLELEVDRMRPIQVNGTKQWIYESGAKRDNPVLLWLDGGPGGTEVSWVRRYLGPLHEYFTVVCWDQRGVGKSARAIDSYEEIRVDDYVEDVITVAKELIETYDQQRIYLLGHSWGSIIGLKAADKAPELFAGYIGAAQQINSIENDSISWDIIHSGAEAAGKTKVVEKLEQLGKPPYVSWHEDGSWTGDGEAYYYLLSKIYNYSPHAPASDDFNSLSMFFAPEHTMINRIQNVGALINGTKKVYPQLAFLDFEQEVKQLQCPLYLVVGDYDYTCPSSIALRWYEQVQAPKKEVLRLERAGHNGVFTEPELFTAFMREIAAGH
ncbi:MAG: alpha/beta fold hydrolase [Spirochaetota bacterium]